MWFNNELPQRQVQYVIVNSTFNVINSNVLLNASPLYYTNFANEFQGTVIRGGGGGGGGYVKSRLSKANDKTYDLQTPMICHTNGITTTTLYTNSGPHTCGWHGRE